MNKMLKLPLFLGACGLSCAGLLSGVHALTKGEIQEYKDNKIKEEYVAIFKNNGYNVVKEDLAIKSSLEVSDELYNVGCSGKAIVEEINGVAYTCKVSGYAGAVEFQVAFANGEYLGYTSISHSETSGYGKDLIDGMTKLLKGLNLADSLFSTSYADAIKGKSKTGKPVGEAIEACRADYYAWLEAQQQVGGNE